MAIVQLSRIQHRRGRKLAGSGMPQLASGELGWAIDTQELYIGNGAVSEGAPAVGNTKVLTEHDNLFELASQYTYKEGTLNGTVSRSLQNRLDEYVSIKNFGALGDGTDQTVKIQTAVNSLFKPLLSNLDDSEKVVLYIPEGTYLVSAPIEIPSYATIVGAGKEKTVFKSSLSSIFKTIKRTNSTIDSSTQPKYIEISNLTIQVDSEQQCGFELDSCEKSVFRNIKFKGIGTQNWMSPNPITYKALLMKSFSTAITCQMNIFENIEFDGFNSGIYSDDDVVNNVFSKCVFNDLNIGVWFGSGTVIGSTGQSIGPSYNTVESSVFDNIKSEGFFVNAGNYNTSRNNKYLNVGNNLGSPDFNVISPIRFVTNNNVSDLDFFSRTDLTLNKLSDPLHNVPYVPEVDGRTSYRNLYARETTIGLRTEFGIPSADLIKLPLIPRGMIYVDYVYEYIPPQFQSTYILREGTLEIICNSIQGTVILNDEYTFTGDITAETALQFKASIIDVGTNENIISIQAINTNFNIDPSAGGDRFYYTIRVKS